VGAAGKLTGEVLDGRYRLLALVGEGGMGCVYRAEHLGLGQRRAVKVLHEERARDTEAAERFLREARMAAKLRHENIMEVIDVGEHDGIPYYVMEWLDGVDLAAVIEREGRLSWERTRGFALQICAGLDLAHRAGVVHRDMKPENCLVLRRADGAERLKILDFGIAKDYTSKQTALTATGEIMGTVYYMPPEQMHGRGDHRVDIYAVGVMLYEMLSGRLPYTGETSVEVMTKVLTGQEPEPLRYVGSQCVRSRYFRDLGSRSKRGFAGGSGGGLCGSRCSRMIAEFMIDASILGCSRSSARTRASRRRWLMSRGSPRAARRSIARASSTMRSGGAPAAARACSSIAPTSAGSVLATSGA
jgi:serine/threonine protein kinase